jgi:hypothetical protein
MAIPIWSALVILYEVQHIGPYVCFGMIVSTSILLLIPGIPWKVKMATAAIELTACAVLFRDVGALRMVFRNGLLG